MYVVTYDGIDYECLPIFSSGYWGFNVLGNPLLSGDDSFEDNGLPFCVLMNQSWGQLEVYYKCGISETHTVTIRTDIVNKLDNVFIDLPIGKGSDDNSVVLNNLSPDNATNEYTVACGYNSKAIGYSAFAEGEATVARGTASHSEGSYTEASGRMGHAEGHYTNAQGESSHAQGYRTKAIGRNSHTQGNQTVATRRSSCAFGEFNDYPTKCEQVVTENQTVSIYDSDNGYVSSEFTFDQDTGFTLSNPVAVTGAPKEFPIYYIKYRETDTTMYLLTSKASWPKFNCTRYYRSDKTEERSGYAVMVGNGTSEESRSNAHTLDWEGNAWFAGSVECTAVIVKSPSGKKFKLSVSDTGTIAATEV